MKLIPLLPILLIIPLSVFSQDDYSIKTISIAECLDLAEKNKQKGDIKEATRYLNTAAMRVWEEKNYASAIEYFNESIELNKQINNTSGISKLNSNLGMIYSDLREFDKSLSYFQQSLDYRLKFGEKTEIISTYINKSVVLNSLKRHSEAAQNLEEALRLATEMSDAAQMKSCYGMLAETYEKAGDQAKTIQYFNLYRTFHEMVQRNKLNDAKKETEEARLHLLETELKEKEKELELLKTSRELKATEKELENMGEEMRSLLTNNTKQQLAMNLLERQLEIDKLKIAAAETTNSKQKIWIAGIIGGMIIVFLLVLLLYRNYRYKKKINQHLSEQNEEIKTLNESLESQVQKRTNELQKTLASLEKRNRDLDQFSHVISHNLRGPVANILGLGKVINITNPADPINVEVFGRLLGVTQNLDAVVKDLSVILQVQDNQAIPKEKISLHDSIKSVMKMLRPEIERSEIDISVEDNSFKYLESVKPYFESILYNLLSNSIKYCSPNRKPTIRISAQMKDQNFVLSVKDNGVGIIKTDMEKVFEPYKRLTLNGDGKGLGLYLVRTQVEAMGGYIELTSEENDGSCFSVYLPQPEKKI